MAPLTLMAASLLLLGAGAILVLPSGGANKALRQRVLAAGSLDTAEPGANVLDIRVKAPTERTFLIRAAELLGYDRNLPPAYAPSLAYLVPPAALVALAAWRLVTSMNPPLAILAATFAALVSTRFLLRRKSKKYATALFRQIPDALSLMLRAVRAGLPIAEALRSVSREIMSPTREEFARVAGEVTLGVPIEAALQHLYERTKLQEYAFFSVVIGLHGQTGGNLSETLENLADMVRRRVAMVAKAKALAADGQVSAIVVGGMPFAVGFVVWFLNPGYIEEFFTNPRGPMLVLTIVVLLSSGLFLIRWMIERSTQD